MKDKKLEIQKEIEKIWPGAKKKLSKVNKDVSRVMKESEKNLSSLYKNIKKNTDILIAKAKREELYYQLGRSVAGALTEKQKKSRKISRIYSQLQQLNKKIR